MLIISLKEKMSSRTKLYNNQSMPCICKIKNNVCRNKFHKYFEVTCLTLSSLVLTTFCFQHRLFPKISCTRIWIISISTVINWRNWSWDNHRDSAHSNVRQGEGIPITQGIHPSWGVGVSRVCVVSFWVLFISE
jgi:hypothetical protein